MSFGEKLQQWHFNEEQPHQLVRHGAVMFEDLTCWSCQNMSSNGECNDWAPNIPCLAGYTICKTMHRMDSETELTDSVSKSCAKPDECSLD